MINGQGRFAIRHSPALAVIAVTGSPHDEVCLRIAGAVEEFQFLEAFELARNVYEIIKKICKRKTEMTFFGIRSGGVSWT